MRVAYIRVSTIEQNTERQEEGLKAYNIEKYFIEKVSGKNANRPELQSMLEFVREGDEVYVWDFSRLARNTKDLLSIVELLENKKVRLVSIKEQLDTSSPSGKLMLTVIAGLNSFFRENMLEAQREGIEIAKKAGKYKGRKPIGCTEKFAELYQEYMQRGISKSQMAKKLKISRPTLNRLFNEYEKNLEMTTNNAPA